MKRVDPGTNLVGGKNLYEVIAETANDFIFILDKDRKVIYINHFGANAFKLPRNKIIGQSITEIFPKNHLEPQIKNLKKVFEKGKTVTAENEFIIANKPHWLQARLVPIKDRNNVVTAVLGISRDITTRKKAEIALKESESRYHQLIELSPDGIVVHQKGKVIFANSTAAKIMKAKSPKEFLGKNVIDFVHPDFRPIVIERLSKMQKGKTVPLIEEKFVRLDGSPVDVEVTATPIVIKDGPAILTVFHDITLRKEAEKTIIANKEHYQALVENVSEGIILLDEKGDFLYKSTSTAKVTGYPVDRFIHRSAFELIHPEDLPIIKKEFARIVKTPSASSSGEFRLLHQNGTWIWVRYIAVNLLANQSVKAVVINLHDITHEKEIDQAKTEFVSLASHQLRTPLAAIKWFIEMVLAGDAGILSEKQKEFVVNINQANQKMIDLVNSLLDVSHLETGKFVLEKEPTNINKVIQKVIEELKPKLIERNQTINITLLPSLPLINTDPKHVGNVLTNLITNAIKFSKTGGQININVSSQDNQAVIRVSDNGYGIPKDEQNRVFEKFYRGSNIVKVSVEGSGLGLYIVKKIIEACEGKIWFESEEGKGTTFWFSLPIN